MKSKDVHDREELQYDIENLVEAFKVRTIPIFMSCNLKVSSD
jgi:hypothetical protein